MTTRGQRYDKETPLAKVVSIVLHVAVESALPSWHLLSLWMEESWPCRGLLALLVGLCSNCWRLRRYFQDRLELMNIVLGSAFRNSSNAHITRWADQCHALESYLYSIPGRGILGLTQDDPLRFRVIAVEGDSINDTQAQLHRECKRRGLELDLRTCNHGGRVFGSTEDEDRLKALSLVGNAILGGVRLIDDVMVYVESDLVWSADTITRLITRVLEGYDVIAPLIFAGEHFYDVFVYRGTDGNRFSPFYPYHHSLSVNEEKSILPLPVEVSSVGSCLVMKADVARTCRIRNGNALLGFCEDVRSKRYKVWVDKTERIEHP